MKKTEPGYLFTLPMDVRDYECDIQGIVNNAAYLQYLEHARHRFIKTRGLDFAQLTKQGIHLVVVRSEVDYKSPLRSGDAFTVGLNIERTSLVRFGFLQDILRVPDKKLMVRAKVICAAMNDAGKPILPKVVDTLFSK